MTSPTPATQAQALAALDELDGALDEQIFDDQHFVTLRAFILAHPDSTTDAVEAKALPVVPEGVHWRPGHERLWNWFSLSYASWLTMPRAFMHAMPEDWQWRMAELCEQWDATWEWPDDMGEATVNQRVNGKLAKWPDYVTSYRHPNTAAIEGLRLEPRPSAEGGE